MPSFRPRKNKKNRPYCDAIGRRQYEAAGWGDANTGCSNYGIEQVEGSWVCHVHRDPKKRYGWNR